MDRKKQIYFGIIDWFSGGPSENAPTFADVAMSVLRTAAKRFGTVDLWPKDSNATLNRCIPLILCETRDELKRRGVKCPYEFVVERNDLLPMIGRNGRVTTSVLTTLSRRLRQLGDLYGNMMVSDFNLAMQDWMAGLFRLYMMLDSSTHGLSRFVDLQKVVERKDPIITALVTGKVPKCGGCQFTDEIFLQAEELGARLDVENVGDGKFSRGTTELSQFKAHLKSLFPDYFDSGKRSIKSILASGRRDKLKAVCKIYEDGERGRTRNGDAPLSHSARLPVAYGDRAKYITPTRKLNLLLIDDDIDASPLGHLRAAGQPNQFKATIHPDDWKLLCEVFNVQQLPIDRNADVREFARECFAALQQLGMTYDLILIDLCLGSMETNSDPDGYAVIRLAKMFFPGTPIVVYSRFKDMEHIARAFFSGARWFLIKGEEAKLPRHVLKLIKHVGWHREWQSVESSSEKPEFVYAESDEFSRKFKRTNEWKYLTYKCLEYLPGQLITVRKMGGGISSAVTFKATKGVKMGKEALQTPSIIKIDSSYNTMMEFERYFRMIRPYMANEAGRIEKPELVLNREYSAIVYTFAGKQDAAHELRAMSDLVENDMLCETTCDFERYRYALNCVFDEILPKIHRVSPTIEFGTKELWAVPETYTVDAFSSSFVGRMRSSFPNPYFNESSPKGFWKSYVMRFQPWGRKTIARMDDIRVQDNQIALVPKDKDERNEIKIPELSCHKLTFHSTMADPENAGKYLIEAYTDNGRLLWLDGDASDFIARYRKHIQPGCSLWFEKPEDPNAAGSRDSGKTSWEDELAEWAVADRRDEWLRGAIIGWDTKKRDASLLECFIETVQSFALPCDDFPCMELQDRLLQIAQKVRENANASDWNCHCPVGIVHGDLNLANVMLESRLHAPKDGAPDTKSTVSDVWFIDFARTRRDIIAHDFNVYFTSVLSTLFHPDLLSDDVYQENLKKNFKTLVAGAIASESKSLAAVPDAFKDDARLSFVYKMLRRGREAALKAGVSQNMYTLTTALACLYTMKIFLNNRPKKIKDPKLPIIKAAGFLAAAKICYDLLPSKMQEAGEARA